MNAVRMSETSASSLRTVGPWGATEAGNFVVEVTEISERPLQWVPREGPGTWLLYMDSSVRVLSIEVAGAMPGRSIQADSDRIEQLLSEPVGTPVSLSREEAAQLVKRLFGSDKSLPTGTEYVEKVRGDWASRLSGR